MSPLLLSLVELALAVLWVKLWVKQCAPGLGPELTAMLAQFACVVAVAFFAVGAAIWAIRFDRRS